MGQGGIFEALNGNIYGNLSNPQTLVLAHGFGSNQGVWHYLIPFLACYFKVVVFDQAFSPDIKPRLYNPYDYSNYTAYADDLVGLLKELDINNSIYLGHSMSAMIGCIASVKRPQLFKQLILLGGSPRYLNDEGYEGGFEMFVVDQIFQQISQNYTSWVERFAPTAIGVNDTNAISEFEQSLMKIDPETTLSVAKTVFLSDWRSILDQVQVPSALIQPKIDFVVPQFVTNYMENMLGGLATVKFLETRGHFPMLTAYPLLLDVIKNVTGVDD